MPYKDAEKQRAYVREWGRRWRASVEGNIALSLYNARRNSAARQERYEEEFGCMS